MKRIILILVLFAILISGCMEEKEQRLEDLGTPQPPMTQEVVPEDAKDVVDLAKKDLSAMLQIPETSVQMIDVIPVEWADTSLGYPEPGVVYEPVTTLGYVIMLTAEDKFYEYHSDYTRIAPPSGPEEEKYEWTQPDNVTEGSDMAELAKMDLATKLQIPPTSIEVLRVVQTEWPDASLGYPEPGMVYAQVITPGYVILLLAENKLYEYHSDYTHIVPPPSLTKKIE
ncbi:hypothetical protein KA005_65620 [bacterium]|nr:hypothetical protein [bacterium]